MIKKKVSTHLAPGAIGPYSQADFVGEFLFASGMIPLDPSTGEVKGKDIKEQTEQDQKHGARFGRYDPIEHQRYRQECK
jgi:2-iminobutanoate/2-iminopropanoate deaminase